MEIVVAGSILLEALGTLPPMGSKISTLEQKEDRW